MISAPSHGKSVVSFYRACATYRPSPVKFKVEDIDPSLCTHLVYCFAEIDDETLTIISADPAEDLEGAAGRSGYKRAVALKERNRNLKVIIAVGGLSERAQKFYKMAADSTTRAQFVDSVLTFLKYHHFDGLNLFCDQIGRNPEDKANFSALIKELKEKFKPYKYLLTATLPGDKKMIESGFDLPTLNIHLNMVLVKAFGYYDYESVIASNASIKRVEATIRYLLLKGISPKKLVLGISLYGATFVLQRATEWVEFGHTQIQGSFRGPILQEENSIGYIEIRHEFSGETSIWSRHWDDATETPYLRHSNKIISYDNPKSTRLKVQMAKSFGLAGIMVWSIDVDDFKGVIKGENSNYNLLRTINSGLNRKIEIEISKKKTVQETNENAKPNQLKSFISYELYKLESPIKISPTFGPNQNYTVPEIPTIPSPLKDGFTSPYLGKYCGVKKDPFYNVPPKPAFQCTCISFNIPSQPKFETKLGMRRYHI